MDDFPICSSRLPTQGRDPEESHGLSSILKNPEGGFTGTKTVWVKSEVKFQSFFVKLF